MITIEKLETKNIDHHFKSTNTLLRNTMTGFKVTPVDVDDVEFHDHIWNNSGWNLEGDGRWTYECESTGTKFTTEPAGDRSQEEVFEEHIVHIRRFYESYGVVFHD